MPNANDTKLPPWSAEKKLKWFLDQRVQRSYQDDVLLRIEALRKVNFDSRFIETYGNLTVNPNKFPLFAFRIGKRPELKTVLITGGVHGYETSGVKGALLFLEKYVASYTKYFNFVVAPCISPWSYETVNRLDPIMENPNRQFKSESQAEESRFLINYLKRLNVEFDAHIDLHETTDSDRIFLPEEYAKNGLVLEAKDVDIPDGFYLIGTKENPRPELEKAMIESVRKVTHIAKADAGGTILDIPVTFEGVIYCKIPGLCAEFTLAKSRMGAYTTEMYPDSPHFKTMATAQVETICSEAQVACIRGALDYWITAA